MATKYYVGGDGGKWNETWTSQYPPVQSDDYVKATSTYTSYDPYKATDPSYSLTGSWTAGGWLSLNGQSTNQRFHIDHGSAKKINRIYYENIHSTGTYLQYGAQNFTFWGSSESTAFAELTYATDTDWTQLTTATSVFKQHRAENMIDPQYILVSNSNTYRYSGFKFADGYGGNCMGARRIELQSASAEHWATSSGGTASYVNKPTYADDVVFDSNSGSGNIAVSMEGFGECNNLYLGNPSGGALTLTGNPRDLRINGSLTIEPGVIFNQNLLQYRTGMRGINKITGISKIQYGG